LEDGGDVTLIIPEEVQVPANLCESSLGVQVLRDGGVVHHFKLQVFGGGRWSGEFLLEGLPGVRGVLIVLERMDEVGVDRHGECAEALVVGVMPEVDPRLVGDLAGFVRLDGRLVGGNCPPCTDGAEVASDEWGPLEIVGAFKSGDTADEGRGGGGHCKRVGFGIRDVSKPSMMKNKKEGGVYMCFMTLSEPGTSET